VVFGMFPLKHSLDHSHRSYTLVAVVLFVVQVVLMKHSVVTHFLKVDQRPRKCLYSSFVVVNVERHVQLCVHATLVSMILALVSALSVSALALHLGARRVRSGTHAAINASIQISKLVHQLLHSLHHHLLWFPASLYSIWIFSHYLCLVYQLSVMLEELPKWALELYRTSKGSSIFDTIQWI